MKVGAEYRFITAGEAPTTVEAPFEDVTLGVRNAVREIEELTGYKLLDDHGIITPSKGENEGVDLYVTTSSAGGGLQMMVIGVIGMMTAESAHRSALGAGAIVMDVMSIDDGRQKFEKIERMRNLRPDMILVAGGTDGGNVKDVVGIGELISSAQPRSRLGSGYDLPIVFAGNKMAIEPFSKLLLDKCALKIVENIRPTLETENPGPSRDAIHELFMEHVMSHAPGYDRLMTWTPIPIMPTPAGEGKMFQTIAETYQENVIGVGLGGATTNVYSYFDEKFTLTISANLGMSYSISNVLKETGIENILRWIPFDVDSTELHDRLLNKMIRPTTIPHVLESLMIEQAVAREALRLGFQHHKFLARPLLGAVHKAELDFGNVFDQKTYEETYIDMLKVDWVAGTGGLLSHAPRRAQSALMLMDGFQPEGVTKLAQDSVFMMPHLGLLSSIHPKAAMEIFEKDCLVHIGTCIAPKETLNKREEGQDVFSTNITLPNGTIIEEDMTYGAIKKISLGAHQKASVEIKPAKGFDVGAGPGEDYTVEVEGGVVGLILDTRGRPLSFPVDNEQRKQKLLEWFKALDAYPSQIYGNQ
jgi:uncharacterized protein (TIGR01319 family)